MNTKLRAFGVVTADDTKDTADIISTHVQLIYDNITTNRQT